MKTQVLISTLLFLLLAFPLFSQQNIKGKVYASSDHYQVAWEKPHTLHLYDLNDELLGSHALPELSKFKNRMKVMKFGGPAQVFGETPRTGYSSLFENATHIILTFSQYIDQEHYLLLVSFDKSTQTFKEESIKYFPFFKPPYKTINNQFILGDLLFIVHINPSMLYWNIRSLRDLNTVLKEFTVSKGKETALLNTGISVDYNVPVIPGFTVKDEPAFYSDKKTVKSMSKMIKKANTWGVKIQANEMAEDYLELTLGSQFFPDNGQYTVERLFYFKCVIDKSTLEHVNNIQLKEAGLSLYNQFQESRPKKKKK